MKTTIGELKQIIREEIHVVPQKDLEAMLVQALADLGLRPKSKIVYHTGSGGPKAITTVMTNAGTVKVGLRDGTGWGENFSDIPHDFEVWGAVDFKRGPELAPLLAEVL